MKLRIPFVGSIELVTVDEPETVEYRMAMPTPLHAEIVAACTRNHIDTKTGLQDALKLLLLAAQGDVYDRKGRQITLDRITLDSERAAAATPNGAA